MSEQIPNEPGGQDQPGDILNEMRELGKNLSNLLRATWESEEFRRLQQDLQSGMNDLRNTLGQTADNLSNSQTGQTLKADLDELGQRLRSGELETQVRNEVANALRKANEEIRKAAESKQPPAPPPPAEGG